MQHQLGAQHLSSPSSLTAAGGRPRRVRILLRAALILVAAESAVLGALTFTPWPHDAYHVLSPVALCAVSLPLLHLFIVRPLTVEAAAAEAARNANEAELRARSERIDFDARLHRALDMSLDEADVFDACGLASVEAAPGAAVELRVADTSQSRLRKVSSEQAVGCDACGCGVGLAVECPALRSGKVLQFSDPAAFDACPHLRRRSEHIHAATCVPVTFMGRGLGVLHVTAPEGVDVTSDDVVDRLASVSAQTGSRLGTLRAYEESRHHARTDALTGLANRRHIDSRIADLVAAETPFAVILADLDHFKAVNDTYGHDAGDKALRLFARVVEEVVRPSDHVARWGGEEILVVLPDAGARTAAGVAERIRSALADEIGTCDGPSFTASFGVADTTIAATSGEILQAADAALYAAKNNGRDQVVVADPIGD